MPETQYTTTVDYTAAYKVRFLCSFATDTQNHIEIHRLP